MGVSGPRCHPSPLVTHPPSGIASLRMIITRMDRSTLARLSFPLSLCLIFVFSLFCFHVSFLCQMHGHLPLLPGQIPERENLTWSSHPLLGITSVQGDLWAVTSSHKCLVSIQAPKQDCLISISGMLSAASNTIPKYKESKH